jgi:hypothetical protein
MILLRHGGSLGLCYVSVLVLGLKSYWICICICIYIIILYIYIYIYMIDSSGHGEREFLGTSGVTHSAVSSWNRMGNRNLNGGGSFVH